jgi:cytoskeleton protein RodZ
MSAGTTPDGHGPGAQLALARARAGLSLREVAARSRVGLDHLESIEREDWLALPGDAYVRGFIRLYAKEVGLNPTLLLDALDHQLSQRELARVQARRVASRRTRLGRLRRVRALVVAGVAAALLAALWAASALRHGEQGRAPAPERGGP